MFVHRGFGSSSARVFTSWIPRVPLPQKENRGRVILRQAESLPVRSVDRMHMAVCARMRMAVCHLVRTRFDMAHSRVVRMPVPAIPKCGGAECEGTGHCRTVPI